MTQAKLLRESLCFTMILPYLLVPSTKPHWHIDKPAKWRKQIGCHVNYASDTRTTPPAGSSLADHRNSSMQVPSSLKCELSIGSSDPISPRPRDRAFRSRACIIVNAGQLF